MPSFSMIIITLALVFYTIGMWGARLTKRLAWRHVVLFWLGLVRDTWGTTVMLGMGDGLTFDVHGVTGLAAILLMLVNAVWATIALVRKDERWVRSFHKFSIWVWLIWLVPYLSPMFLAIG